MKELLDKLRIFFKGWEKHGEHERPNTFLKYFMYYPLNWMCTLCCILFVVLFIKGAIKYESPLLWTATLFPLIIMVYNSVDEYYAFKWYSTQERKISAKTLQNIAKYSCGVIMVYLIIRTFITG